jgi:serine/threonine-protein kinase
MLTGNVPFNGKNPTEVMQKHLKAPLIPPDHVNGNLSGGISEVIEMMMAKSRKLRYKNCHDLLIDLKAVRRGEQPPIAHKEVTGADLAAVAAVAQSQTAEVAQDKTTQPSPFDYPIVQGLIAALVVMTALCAVFGIMAFI